MIERIKLLPHWCLTDLGPAFYDTESATAVEQTAKIYGAMRELQTDYNKFVDEVNACITEFVNDSNSDQEEFENHITEIIHNYIMMIDEKIKMQDKVIDENITFIKENIAAGLQEILNEMIATGKLDVIIMDAFNDLNARLLDIEKARTVQTTEEMKALTGVTVGTLIKTAGYYLPNDGGGSEYHITDIKSDNEYQEELNNGLYATLILKNSMNVDCFGAYGDGTHDDTSYIQKAINYCSGKSVLVLSEKTYLIGDILDFKDNIYNCNNATLKINIDGERKRESLFINDLFNSNENTLNKITINNLNIEDVNSPYAQTFSFKNCCAVFNKVNVYKTHKGSVIDLYGVNSNSLIKDCNITIEVNDPTLLASCILVRGFGSYDTENVEIINCNLTQNTLDETIWVSSGYINLKNIKITNCVMNDKGNADNTLFVGVNRTGSIENIIVANNIINKTLLKDRCISIAKTQNEDKTLLPHKNIIFSNNIINVFEGNSTNNNIITYGYGDDVYHELSIANNEINYSGNTNIKAVIEGKVISNFNKINASKANHSFRDTYISKNDYIKSINGYVNLNECSNITADLTGNFLEDSQGTGTTDISNSKIKCNYLISFNKTNNSKYYVKNNCIETTNTHIINNYNPIISPTVVLIDNFILGNSQVDFIKNNACKLIAKNNFYSSSDELEEYKGIPKTEIDRSSYIVGSVLFSKNQNKSIVRKINDGSSTSDWEEI